MFERIYRNDAVASRPRRTLWRVKTWILPTMALAIVAGCRSSSNAQQRFETSYAAYQADGFSDREMARLSKQAVAVAESDGISDEARFDTLLRAARATSEGGSYKRSRRARGRIFPALLRLSRHDDHRLAQVIQALSHLGRFDPSEAKKEEQEYVQYLDKVAAVGPVEWVQPAVAWARAHHRVARDLHVEPISEAERAETREWIKLSYRGCEHLPDSQWASDVRQFCSRSMSQLDQLVIGRPAPEIASRDFSGRDLRLSEYRGKIVVVSFWATWCKPCMAKFDDQRDLVNAMQGKPFALLGVNNDRDAARARAVAGNGKLNWRNFRDDPEAGAGECADAFAVRMWPSVFVLDAEGVVRAINPRRDDLWDICKSLVAEVEDSHPIAAAAGSD